MIVSCFFRLKLASNEQFTFKIVLDRLRNESGDEEDASEESDENDEDHLNTTRSAIIN